PSLVPTFLLSSFTSREVKVVLGGDGSDEILAGYPTYFAQEMASFYKIIPRMIRSKIFPKIVNLLPVSDGYQSWEWKLKRFILRWNDQPAIRHLQWMS